MRCCFAAQRKQRLTFQNSTQRVTDLTSTLDAGQIQALEAKLAAFESRKGSQIAVLLVPSTQPETIEQYGIRVVDSWKLGRKGVDDGVLLLIAKDDRKLRIEVGYGLEGALNDATAKRIVSEIIGPDFKRGEFYAGIDAGVDAIIKVVEGEPLPPPAQVHLVAIRQRIGQFWSIDRRRIRHLHDGQHHFAPVAGAPSQRIDRRRCDRRSGVGDVALDRVGGCRCACSLCAIPALRDGGRRFVFSLRLGRRRRMG